MARRGQVLGELLISQRLLTREQLSKALEIQRNNPAPLGSILVQCGFITPDMVVKALAAQLGVAPWFLTVDPPSPEVVQMIPAEVCRQHSILPITVKGNLLTLGMKNPMDIQAIDLARNWTKMRIEPVFVDPNELEAVLAAVENKSGSKFTGLDKLVKDAIRDFGGAKTTSHEKSMLSEADTRPVIGVVNQILSEAVRLGASDVHIEPGSSKLAVRYRVDGQLVKILDFPVEMTPMIATRLKIMAELDVVEHRIPQDGRINASVDNRDIDMRVSVQPSYHGPRIVLRILDKAASLRQLSELGFSSSNELLFKQMIKQPHGLVLVTGPTGSGKTTTLYAALQELRDESRNVMTCEDPVEYEIEGIAQSSINEKIGLTFASLLRSCLRQDPDIILVGEIRDQETAETAIRAALTGHLVLSTLHCNDAPSAIPRLIDMGIDPYLLSTCLIGVTAQRLVRRLCPDCKRQSPNTAAAKWAAEKLGLDIPISHFEHKGCPKCGHSGFRGRVGIHEVMPVVDEISNAIAHQAPLVEMYATAKSSGYRPMLLDALDRLADGETTLCEIERSVGLEDFLLSVDSNSQQRAA